MELSYWTSRWRKGHIGFHMEQVYPLLPEAMDQVAMPPGGHVFVPLSGKSHDIGWFLEQGYRVTAAELSEVAVSALRTLYPFDYSSELKGESTIYRSEQLTIWQGDINKIQPEWMPAFDLIYDKAALIALPPERRTLYASRITDIAGGSARILQQVFEYDQDEMNGPPFSVTRQELEQHYGKSYHIRQLAEVDAMDRLAKFRQRGLQSYLWEKVYLLRPKEKGAL